MNIIKRLKQKTEGKYSGKCKLWWTLQHIKRDFNKVWRPVPTYHPWVFDAPVLNEAPHQVTKILGECV